MMGISEQIKEEMKQGLYSRKKSELKMGQSCWKRETKRRNRTNKTFKPRTT